jgi:hypothetical protein
MYIETYKNENIYKFNGLYQIGLSGVSCSKIDFLKMLIDKKIKNANI